MNKYVKLVITIFVVGVVVFAGVVYLVQPSFVGLETSSEDPDSVRSPTGEGTLDDPPAIPGTVQQQYESSPVSYNRYIEYCRTSGDRRLFLMRRDQGDFDRQIFYYTVNGELLDSYSAGDYHPPEQPFDAVECNTLQQSSRQSSDE